MKTFYKRTIMITILILLFSLQCVLAQNLEKPLFIKLSNEYFQLVKKKDYTKAAKLFHYPENYSKEQLQMDTTAVSKALEYLFDEFGELQSCVESNENNPKVHTISLWGGNERYWQKHHSCYKLVYSVKFQKDGNGYICILFCNINNNVHIKQVNFALAQSTFNANKRIQQITQGLLDIARKYQ